MSIAERPANGSLQTPRQTACAVARYRDPHKPLFVARAIARARARRSSPGSGYRSLASGFYSCAWLLLLLYAVPAAALEDPPVPPAPGAKTPAAPVTLVLKWQPQFQFAGYYIALHKGYYRDSGLDVTVRHATDYSEPIAAVLNGDAQFGVAGSDIVIAKAKGAPVVVLASVFQHSPLVLIARQDSRIGNLHDLVGKRVMLEPHSAELRAYLRDEGIDENRLIRYPHIFDVAPLIHGTVDAMSAYVTDEPYLLEQAGVEYIQFSPRAGGIDFYGDSLFATATYIRNEPNRTRAFLESSLRGWRYAMSHVDETIDLIQAKYGIRHTREHLKYEAERMRAAIMPDRVPIGHTNPGRWQHIAQTYAGLGMIDDRFDLNGFVYDGKAQGLDFFGAILKGLVAAAAVLALATMMFLTDATRSRHRKKR
jgi:two-component system, sensor histidine kinase and response regulator